MAQQGVLVPRSLVQSTNMAKDDNFVASLAGQAGKVHVITGGNSGIGLEAAVQIAKKQATVVLACRNKAKAEVARAEVVETQERAGCEDGMVKVANLDLSSLESVKAFVGEYREVMGGDVPMDVLVLNAGVMALPKREL